MEWKTPPEWLEALYNKGLTKKHICQVLGGKGYRKTFMDRDELDAYLQHAMLWSWKMKWREEQEMAIQSFFDSEYSNLVIQAVFGSGKTTMMLAIIHILLVRNYTEARHIQVFSFNVAIKNEIRKKLQNNKIGVRTFDSLVYRLCAEMGMEDLKLPNFSGKRRFVLHHLDEIAPMEDVCFVFVDEAQDLEKSCFHILRKRFPCAKILWVGDIFQSIQKEPRESLLWYLLQEDIESRKIVTMKTTPRVPAPILSEIARALETFYPEFKTTIREWRSDNHRDAKIVWKGFSTYKEVYDQMLVFCNSHKASDVMILTFSSAITVRGSLGDVARVRKFLQSNGILTNPNHKNMLSDRVFLSTANSSKGLERRHVFCFLTFPLEKAFANFSNDLVVNIVTVALSRALETVTAFIPSHIDRFSSVLELYEECPMPHLMVPCTKKKKPEMADHFQEVTNIRSMLEQEHGVTELLRQNILSFETKQFLRSFSKKYRSVPIASLRVENFRTEEGSAFVGILLESLILSSWKNSWPFGPCSMGDVTQHEMFSHFHPMIKKSRASYLAFIKKNPCTATHQFQGCLLYARLHLAVYQKLFVRLSKDEEQRLRAGWAVLRPTIQEFRPPCDLNHLKIQSNVAMAFVTGIADSMVVTEKTCKDPLEVIEIKASRAPEWQEHALIQSILYGLMMGRSYFRTHLMNVCSKEFHSFAISFKGSLMDARQRVQLDCLLWNVNCYLAKNVTHNDPSKPYLHVDGCFVVDGRQAEDVYTLVEMTSPTKMLVLGHRMPLSGLEEMFQQIQSRVRLLVIGCFLPDYQPNIHVPTQRVDLPVDRQWSTFLKGVCWDEEEQQTRMTHLDWDCPMATLSVQICSLCQKLNFV